MTLGRLHSERLSSVSLVYFSFKGCDWQIAQTPV